MAVRNLAAKIYTSDDGRQYAIKVDADVFAQENPPGTPIIGGADYAGAPALPPFPTNRTPRHVVVESAGNRRRVTILSLTAPLWTGAVSTVNLRQIGAAGTVAYTVLGNVGERGMQKYSTSD